MNDTRIDDGTAIFVLVEDLHSTQPGGLSPTCRQAAIWPFKDSLKRGPSCVELFWPGAVTLCGSALGLAWGLAAFGVAAASADGVCASAGGGAVAAAAGVVCMAVEAGVGGWGLGVGVTVGTGAAHGWPDRTAEASAAALAGARICVVVGGAGLATCWGGCAAGINDTETALPSKSTMGYRGTPTGSPCTPGLTSERFLTVKLYTPILSRV